MSSDQQFLRSVSLIVSKGEKGLDLSDLHFKFKVEAADAQTPNNAAIRVYNLSKETAQRVRAEFDYVALQAGYESSKGIIFQGNIKQFRFGKETPTDTFLDILAGDGDLGYNFGFVSKTFAAGSTPLDWATEASSAMGVKLVNFPENLVANPALARGKVGFGMARAMMSNAANTLGSTWSIQNGEVQITPLDSYSPGEAVVINSLTGMVGFPEQTENGVKVRTLLNPKINCGQLIKLNNKDITQLQLKSIVPFNVRVGIQFAAPLAADADGLYRVFTIDHSGDTRAREWFSDMIALAVDPSSGKVLPFG